MALWRDSLYSTGLWYMFRMELLSLQYLNSRLNIQISVKRSPYSKCQDHSLFTLAEVSQKCLHFVTLRRITEWHQNATAFHLISPSGVTWSIKAFWVNVKHLKIIFLLPMWRKTRLPELTMSCTLKLEVFTLLLQFILVCSIHEKTIYLKRNWQKISSKCFVRSLNLFQNI